MNDHITNWLAAFHDGELRGRRLAQVEAHLTQCADCQEKLLELEALSGMLGEVLEIETSIPADRFAAQVGLQLTRRPLPKAEQVSSASWRWAVLPVSLLVGIAFLQVVQWLENSLILAQIFGYGKAAVSRLTFSAPEPSGIFSRISSELISFGVPFSPQILLGLILPAVLAVGYMVWLIVWGLNQGEIEAAKI